MSVDLAGSTAFKNGQGSLTADRDPFPAWIGEIKRFYDHFPSSLAQKFQAEATHDLRVDLLGYEPKVWKTIGDEILFSCRLLGYHHLSIVVKAFIKTLKDYGVTLSTRKIRMDVKGAGWIAAFPVPNATVTKADLGRSAYLDEVIEEAADNKPGDFDFLGSSMDAGFRVARFAEVDRLALSAELAWLLTKACAEHEFPELFVYHGRHVLKGVLSEHTYPVFMLDAERQVSRRRVRERELKMTGMQHPSADQVFQFLEAFMEDEGMELPILPLEGSVPGPAELPQSYKEYARKAQIELEELVQRENSEKQSETDEGGIGDVPPEVQAGLSSSG